MRLRSEGLRVFLCMDKLFLSALVGIGDFPGLPDVFGSGLVKLYNCCKLCQESSLSPCGLSGLRLPAKTSEKRYDWVIKRHNVAKTLDGSSTSRQCPFFGKCVKQETCKFPNYKVFWLDLTRSRIRIYRICNRCNIR